MIYIKTNAEIELIRESCLLVSATLSEVATFLCPGLTTLEIDTLVEDFIRSHGATPSFKNYKGLTLPLAILADSSKIFLV
jgi:methionyl aminopeptidase